MIGYLEMQLGYEILWARRMACELQKKDQIFDLHLRIIFPQYREAICLQCFLSTCYVSGWPRVHMYVTTFTRFAKNHK